MFKLEDDVRIDVEEEVVEYEEEEEEELDGDEEDGEDSPLDFSRPAVSFFLFK